MLKLSFSLACYIWLACVVLEINQISAGNYKRPVKCTNGDECERECVKGEPPKTCYYRWIVQNYVTVGEACGNCPDNKTACYNPQCVTADGFEKGIKTINRRIPGPDIQVCLGDRVIVDLENKLPAGSATIHWHGVFQRETKYMDGVPGITQCTIAEGNTFRYDFWANNEGTHYWHSHDGLQKLDGIQGNLVIRTPKEDDPNRELYDIDDPEHVLNIMDWMHFMADEKMPGFRFTSPGQDADSFLINGRGRTKLPASQGNRSSLYPYLEVRVSPNKRYRLRIVAGLCTVCGVQLSIEGHSMTVIATDGNPVKPREVDSINLFSGERYDVVISANQTPRNYWIHMKGISLCAANEVFGLSILNYENAPNGSNSEEPGYGGFLQNGGKVLNPENATCGSENNAVCITELQSAAPKPNNWSKKKCSKTITIGFGFHIFEAQDLFDRGEFDLFYVAPDRTLLVSWVNNISHVAPPSPLLSQRREIPKDQICTSDQNGMPICAANKKKDNYCECTHVIQLPLNCSINIILADLVPLGDLQHPFHLHGYAFEVLAQGQFINGLTLSRVSANFKSGKLKLAKNPPLKDAVAVPSNGYTIIRFWSDNPGYWFFHCHFMYHLASGMAVVFQVGNERDWPPAPKGFPRCGDYQPTVCQSSDKIYYPEY